MEIKQFITICCIALVLSACSTFNKPNLSLDFISDKNLNPDSTLVSLPMRVNIYQLSDASAFKDATFRQIWKHDTQVLGQSLLQKKSINLNPGKTIRLKLKRHEDAEYIAVAGIFNHHQNNNNWKDIKKLPGNFKGYFDKFVIKIKGQRLEIM